MYIMQIKLLACISEHVDCHYQNSLIDDFSRHSLTPKSLRCFLISIGSYGVSPLRDLINLEHCTVLSAYHD